MNIKTKDIIKPALVYCGLSAVFSLIGILTPEKGPQLNPVLALSIQEVGGHFLFGLIAGAVSLSLRYMLVGGLFAVLIDSDHLIGLSKIDAVARMGHSITFGVFALVVMLLVFGKKDYILAGVAFGSVFSHMSFDTFLDEKALFPVLAPFYNHQIQFPNYDWIVFETIAVIIIGCATLLKTSRYKSAVLSDA